MKHRHKRDQVIKHILRFFSAYDASRDLNILILKKQYAQRKKENLKIKTFQATDFSEKTEIENLFLDCLEATKKDYIKTQASKLAMKAGSADEMSAHNTVTQ